jgi:hypothetical protein
LQQRPPLGYAHRSAGNLNTGTAGIVGHSGKKGRISGRQGWHCHLPSNPVAERLGVMIFRRENNAHLLVDAKVCNNLLILLIRLICPRIRYITNQTSQRLSLNLSCRLSHVVVMSLLRKLVTYTEQPVGGMLKWMPALKPSSEFLVPLCTVGRPSTWWAMPGRAR